MSNIILKEVYTCVDSDLARKDRIACLSSGWSLPLAQASVADVEALRVRRASETIVEVGQPGWSDQNPPCGSLPKHL